MSKHTHMYQFKAWRALRLEQLQKEPLCRFCKERGIVTAATVADHIEPHRGDLEKFWDASNLQSLCSTCHSVDKQIIENGGTPKRKIDENGFPQGW